MQASYRHKLSRARFHIAGLRDAFLADHKAGRFRPDVTKHDAASGTRFQATFRVPEEQMVSYSLMAGDGIQNLRATLDHLAYALAGSRRREGLTQFPICATVREYAENGLSRLDGISGAAQTKIEALQPYHAGGDVEQQALRKLNRMSNRDKHRLLQLVTLELSGETLREVETVQPIDPAIHAGYTSTGLLKDGATTRTFDLPESGKNIQYDIGLHLAFQDFKPSVGTDALQLLAELLRAVEDVVTLLEPDVP